LKVKLEPHRFSDHSNGIGRISYLQLLPYCRFIFVFKDFTFLKSDKHPFGLVLFPVETVQKFKSRAEAFIEKFCFFGILHKEIKPAAGTAVYTLYTVLAVEGVFVEECLVIITAQRIKDIHQIA